MKNLFVILIICIISCSPKRNNSIREVVTSKDLLNVTDTLRLSGFIFFNSDGMNKNQFYIIEKTNVLDTIKYIKKIKKKSEDYIFIQPYEAKKKNLYFNYCSSNDSDSQEFLNTIRYKKKIIWSFINNEEFIILKDKNEKKYLTFKCWKPFIEISPRWSE